MGELWETGLGKDAGSSKKKMAVRITGTEKDLSREKTEAVRKGVKGDR